MVKWHVKGGQEADEKDGTMQCCSESTWHQWHFKVIQWCQGNVVNSVGPLLLKAFEPKLT